MVFSFVQSDAVTTRHAIKTSATKTSTRHRTTMKLLKLAPLAVLGAFTASSYAQSSVTLYGLISGGVGFATNQGGHNAYQALSGTNQNPRWGLKGREDLGGGLSAVFQLENGFNLMTGTA